MRITEVENPMVLPEYRTQNDDYFTDVIDVDCENDLNCVECGQALEREDAEPSELWEFEYLCWKPNCQHKHYQGWRESMKKTHGSHRAS